VRDTGTPWGGFIQMLSCVAKTSGESAPTGILSQRCRCVRDAGTPWGGFIGGEETGFLNQGFGLETTSVTETRFLAVSGGGKKKPGF
jgi:hypothetical protein